MIQQTKIWLKQIRLLIAPKQDVDYGMLGPKTQAKRSLAFRPEFYLTYLLFYFVPWFFRPPAVIDVVAALVAVAVFLPIYFRASAKLTPDYIPHMLAIEGIAFALTPFYGMAGTFHIYAVCQAGFQSNKRIAIYSMMGLTIAWIVVASLMGRNIYEIGFTSFIGIISAIGTMGSAEQIQFGESVKRNRVLDQQLAAVAERERIARDLHDLLGHTLTMVALKSEVAEKLIRRSPERAEQEIREIRDATRTALKDVRKTVAGMVETTLEQEIDQARNALDAAGISFEILGAVPSVSHQASTAAGLAVREAVTNIVRHSQAKKAKLVFSSDEEGLEIIIEDNGLGAETPEGAGLTGLRKRIEGLGGSVTILSHHGTKLNMNVPLSSTDGLS